MSKKTLSVRIPPELHTKVYADENDNAYIVEKALRQFYRIKEPNETLFADTQTNVYDGELVQSLNDEIAFLRGQVTFLQKQNSHLSAGWFGRLRLLLESKKEP